MRCAAALLALLLLGGGQAMADEAVQPSPTPSAAPQKTQPADVTLESNPDTGVKTFSLQATYTGATYGPGNFQVTQIIPRLAAFNVGKSLLRLSLPRVQTVNGLDSGYSDTQFFYLFQRPVSAGRKFAGIFGQLPTASGRLFGTGKWLLGPAAAYIFSYRPRQIITGVLIQSAFSVAGPKSRGNQSAVTILPFGNFAIGRGWFWKLAEAPWVFDLQRGASVIPLGLGIGRFAKVDGEPVLIAISDETSVIHANAVNAPKNTIRLTITVLLRSATSPGVP